MAIRCKEVDEYISLIEKGQILVSKEVALLIENEVKPLINGDTTHIFYDEKMYYDCLSYIERFYFPLFPYQKFLVFFHFLYEKMDGFMVLYYNEYLYLMGRGNGKDGLIAPLINFFQTKTFKIKGYNIDIIANAEEQSKGTYDVAYDMMTSPKFKDIMSANFKINKEEIQNKYTKSTLTYNTSNGKTKDGRRPGCLVFNEVHQYQNYDQINVHTSGLGKVEYPRTITITTNGEVRDGPLDDNINTSLEKLNGQHPKLRLFPFLCRLSEEDDWKDIRVLQKANPSLLYRPILRTQIEDDLIKIPSKPSMLNEFLSKRCNLTKNGGAKPLVEWKFIEQCTRELPKLNGLSCIVGIDYASFRDFVSVGCLFWVENEWVFIQHSFVCRNSPTLPSVKFDLQEAEENGELTFCEGETIDENLIENYLLKIASKYNIISVACDSFRFSMLKNILLRVGFTERTKQNPYGQIVLVRSGAYTHTQLHPLVEDVFAKGILNYGQSKLMRWYTNNVKLVPTGNGVLYGKSNAESRKTDGFMAFVHAFSLKDEIPINTYQDNDVFDFL